MDGSGKDELLVGYRLLDSDGSELWAYPLTEDHTDEIVAGKWKKDDPHGYFACVSGTQGFFVGDMYGHILKRDLIGHAQRVSVANYRPELDGLQIAVTTFWGHQGVLLLYDQDGRPLWEMENEMNGNIVAPVNWDGDGTAPDGACVDALTDVNHIVDGDIVRVPENGQGTLTLSTVYADV